MHIFTPNHVQLLNACYPPTSALLAAGSNYSPNSHELSRLTYYVSNHPGKLDKMGGELEKRIKAEARKARVGNMRTRASLLVSLAILRALAIECRRDINIFSPSLISSVDATLSNVPTDLEVIARAASVFTAWTTYTDGHLIGVDANFTRDYVSTLGHFSNLSCSDASDQETRNRTRLVGIAALMGAANSEALYNSSSHFRPQVSAMMRPILLTLLQTNLGQLDDHANDVKEGSISPYLAEFRTRPAMERRAASIHAHIDGDNGPSAADVLNAVLRVLFALLSHANGSQLGQIIQSTFDNLDALSGWSKIDCCCWFTRKMAEWSQYQYRYVVPTWLVERLLENQEAPATTPLLKALLLMVTAVLDSSIPLVDLSSSDILSNLVSLMVRRVAKDPQDGLLPAVVQCIASLGRHVHYSDQIQDLAGEIINRLTIVELQGVPGTGKHSLAHGRSEAIRSLLAALQGLIHTANKQESLGDRDTAHRASAVVSDGKKMTGQDDSHFRRSRVPPDIWHDTLSLLCDCDYAVRADYADLLIFYLTDEMPKRGDSTRADGVRRAKRLTEGPFHATAMNAVLHAGDFVTKVVNAIHAYLYILSTTCSLGLCASPASPSMSLPDVTVDDISHPGDHRSLVTQAPRSRKVSKVQKLAEQIPEAVTSSCSACLADYTHILNILTTIHEQTPVRGLLAGVPMLLALHASTKVQKCEDNLAVQRILIIREVIARIWLILGKVWNSMELVEMVHKTLSAMPSDTMLLDVPHATQVSFQVPREPIDFAEKDVGLGLQWTGVDPDAALKIIAACHNVQQATGLDTDVLLRRFTAKWSVDIILKDSFDRTSVFDHSIKGDGLSPLLKISPSLMHDNISLHSLARSARGVGVTELREALEGRGSMSNPALANAPSISTLDHASSVMNGDLGLSLSQTRSKSRTKRPPLSGSGEVRDVLNRLGISKQNANLLKASFPALHKSVQK
ncbi:hypothetical protein AX17_001071 [Amanita inopinata Kibby_2008]|nr:hypothetical protein AX17_001071 [Amanita inopinata Kibby_2008]